MMASAMVTTSRMMAPDRGSSLLGTCVVVDCVGEIRDWIEDVVSAIA